MNTNSLGRKTAYILAIVGLLLPLFYLGSPPGKGLGGVVSQLRNKYKMGQANLGKLDPTSESMRLATLGMRGIASTVLWLRADYYKEEKYFDRFSATLNQIALLQPHFISVWQHQAHNMSYNVSPEFEDYRQRYEWVKKGMDYLVRGTKFNSRKPILQYDLGQYFGNKLGKADEHKQYRDLFRKDDDFHDYLIEQGLNARQAEALGPDQRPDNWLVGKLWYQKAYALVADGANIKKSAHLLYSYAPLWHMYHAEAMEEEGVLDARAQFAWEVGGNEWATYGGISLPATAYIAITMRGYEAAKNNLDQLKAEFANFTEEARKKAVDIRRTKVPADKLAIYDKPESERNNRDYATFVEVTQMLNPSYTEVAAQLPRKEQLKALELAGKLSFAEETLRNTESFRGQVNYAYWEVRSLAEREEKTVEARRMMFEADRLIDVADLKGALEKYEGAWVRWDKVFRFYPSMMTEEVGDDVLKSLNRYRGLIDKELDDSFVLFEFMKFRAAYNADSLDFNVERALAEWTSRSNTLGNKDDFFESPLAPLFNIQSNASKIGNSAETKDSNAGKEGESGKNASEMKDATSGVGGKTEPGVSGQPPTLENPDSQD